MAKKKINPETWVLGSAMLVGALIIACNLRGCKNCEPKPVNQPKAKADTVYVRNNNATIVNGNNNVVNINQGSGNKIENNSCARTGVQQTKSKAGDKVGQVKKTATPVARTADTLALAAKQDNKVVVDYTETIVDCHAVMTQTTKKAYFTKVGDKMRLDSINVISQDTIKPQAQADTVYTQTQNARKIKWAWQKSK